MTDSAVKDRGGKRVRLVSAAGELRYRQGVRATIGVQQRGACAGVLLHAGSRQSPGTPARRRFRGPGKFAPPGAPRHRRLKRGGEQPSVPCRRGREDRARAPVHGLGGRGGQGDDRPCAGDGLLEGIPGLGGGRGAGAGHHAGRDPGHPAARAAGSSRFAEIRPDVFPTRPATSSATP
jgi:hypothetical protein